MSSESDNKGPCRSPGCREVDEAWLSAILASATQVSIIATDPKGVITLFNPGAERMLGYDASEMVGMKTPESIHLASEVEARGEELSRELGRKVEGFDVFVEHARQAGAETREWTYLHKDGPPVLVELSVTAIAGGDGRPIGFLGIATDITARKQAEQELQKSRGRLKALISAAVEGIFTVDKNGRVMDMNASAADIFGYARSEVIGKNVSMLMPEPHRSQHTDYIHRFLETGEARIVGMSPREVPGLRRDGSLIPLELSVNVTHEGGETLFVGILRDITVRKRYQTRLNAAYSELAAKQEALDKDLKAAAAIQESLLPKHLEGLSGLELDWWFQPSQDIGGDIFNIIPLDGGTFAFYMLDVSGHGVPSALVAVTVSQALSPEAGVVRDSLGEPRLPQEVLSRLEDLFPMERFDKYFSMFYMVYHPDRRRLFYSNAGQPPPLYMGQGGPAEELTEGGSLIGLGGVVPHAGDALETAPGDMLFIYTDGCIEHENAAGEQFGPDRLTRLLEEMALDPVDHVVEKVVEAIGSFGGPKGPKDDLTLVCLKFK